MCNYLNTYTNSNDAHYFRYTSFMKNVQKMYSFWIDHLTWRGVLWYFSKKNILIPNVAEKNILILVEEKK